MKGGLEPKKAVFSFLVMFKGNELIEPVDDANLWPSYIAALSVPTVKMPCT
jgi:hypothetical protein